MDNSADLDSMTHIANDLDDLGNLFEFGDIDLNTLPGGTDFGEPIQQQHVTHPNTPFQDMSEVEAMGRTAAQDFGGNNQFSMPQPVEQQQHQHHYRQQRQKIAPTSSPFTVDPIYQASVQQGMYHQTQPYQMHQHHGFPHNQHVPPTPNSFEMHGETGRFMQQQQHSYMDPHQRAIMEQQYGIRKDDMMAMTPTSPAGTPQFGMLPEFTTPGAYFSPLTSPMLHAQIQQHQQHMRHQQGYATNPSTAPSSNTNSPIDPNIDVDMLDDGMVLPDSVGPQPRKTRRKIATPKTAAARGQVKPSQRTSKRKSASQNPPSGANEIVGQRGLSSMPPSGNLQMPAQPDSSEAESISPEPLSESVMGPPPRPGSRSVQQSPNIIPQQQGAMPGPAATPKSLLTMRSSQPHPMNGQQITDQAIAEPARLDDLALPEAAKQTPRRPSLTQINTSIPLPDGEDDTPRLSARKTPKLGPSSTPSSTRPSSALESPGLGSPMTASTPSAILNRGGKGSKKRGSMSANGSKLVSPALVPKISPSIKPLLPEGTPLNSAQQAMLLASKSNYQNLVEGNRLPGVNYPDSLSTGLTSKRTSHKVAEQGRRNRINDALKEMQALIPKPAKPARSPSKDDDPDTAIAASPDAGAEDDKVGEMNGGTNGKESKEEAISKSNSSKAATVELANEYIKKMQKDSAAQFAEVEKLRRENEELKRKLAGGSQASSDGGASAGSGAAQSPEQMSEGGVSASAEA